jgi:SPP1 family predicted phage head-tail adaptor
MSAMINPGKLTRQITLERKVEAVAPSGAVSETWAPYATVRAELVQLGAEDYLTGAGEGATNRATFRLWYLDGVTTADRVTYNGETYQIIGLVELGTRRGLELLAVSQ